MVTVVVVLGCWLDFMILKVFSNFKDSMIKDILELEILTLMSSLPHVVLICSQSLVLFSVVGMSSAALNINFSPHLNSFMCLFWYKLLEKVHVTFLHKIHLFEENRLTLRVGTTDALSFSFHIFQILYCLGV